MKDTFTVKKVIIAMDSYKGCLSSIEAEKAAEEGVRAVLVEATHGTYRSLIANDPLMRPMVTRYGVSCDERLAFIEMAAISGLPLLTEAERNPMLTTTFGTGELILHALEHGHREFIIGIGAVQRTMPA